MGVQLLSQSSLITATLGGAVLGVAAAGKLLLTGRVLGISGVFKGFIRGCRRGWRGAFLGGMAAGAVVAAAGLPGAFETLPETFTAARAALGGLLVGFGASIGNGCTSGHGICGNARFNKRSLVYTLVFMASGAVTATLTGTASATGLATGTVSAGPDMHKLGLLVPGALLTMLVLGLIGRKVSADESKKEVSTPGFTSLRALEYISEAASGLYFALGLAVSGMIRPSKVAAFLTPLSPAWDPSLMFVMAAALAAAAPAFQAVQRGWLTAIGHKPIVCTDFNIPKNSAVDWKLLLGGVVFGAGWGVSGMCPGPALVSLAVPSVQTVAYLGSMLLGMVMESKLIGD